MDIEQIQGEVVQPATEQEWFIPLADWSDNATGWASGGVYTEQQKAEDQITSLTPQPVRAVVVRVVLPAGRVQP